MGSRDHTISCEPLTPAGESGQGLSVIGHFHVSGCGRGFLELRLEIKREFNLHPKPS